MWRVNERFKRNRGRLQLDSIKRTGKRHGLLSESIREANSKVGNTSVTGSQTTEGYCGRREGLLMSNGTLPADVTSKGHDIDLLTAPLTFILEYRCTNESLALPLPSQ